MDPHEKDLPVVVNCVLEGNILGHTTSHFMTNSSKQSLTLQYAKGKSVRDYIPVDDAEVYITCKSDSPYKQEDTISFVHVEGCLWEFERSVRISPETEYTLHVEIPGRARIWATTKTLPSLRVGNGVSKEVEEDIDLISHVSWDEFARWPNRLDVNGSLEGCSLYIVAQEYSPDGWIDLDYLVTDHPGVDDFNIVEGRFLDIPIVLGSPEDIDPYYNNLVDMCYRIDQEIMSDLPLHKSFLRIDNLADGDLFYLSAGPIWYPNIYTNFHDKGHPIDGNNFFHYNCYFVNNDLDEYLRSIERHTFETDHYLTTVYSTDPGVISNIHNGIGFFGSSYTFIKEGILR